MEKPLIREIAARLIKHQAEVTELESELERILTRTQAIKARLAEIRDKTKLDKETLNLIRR